MNSSWLWRQVLGLTVFVLAAGYFISSTFNSLNKAPAATRQMTCGDCGGGGQVQCFYCQGRGFNKVFNASNLNFDPKNSRPQRQEEKVCSYCNGDGTSPCRSCAGKGLVSVPVVKAVKP